MVIYNKWSVDIMKKVIFVVIIFVLGIFCGFIIESMMIKNNKSSALLLRQNGEEITLDFSETPDGHKIQFFQNHRIESSTDSITIYK
jgi:hypothetical protein